MTHELSIGYRQDQPALFGKGGPDAGQILITVRNTTESGAVPGQVLANAAQKILQDLSRKKSPETWGLSFDWRVLRHDYPEDARAAGDRILGLAHRIGLILEMGGGRMILDPRALAVILGCTVDDAGAAMERGAADRFLRLDAPPGPDGPAADRADEGPGRPGPN